MFLHHIFSRIWCIILFYLWKGKFQGLHESQGKSDFRIFRVMGKLLYEIQDFQDPLDSFQDFQGFLNILHWQDKLVSYFHSKPSTLWHLLTLDLSLYLFSEFSKTDNFNIMTIWMNKVSFFQKIRHIYLEIFLNTESRISENIRINYTKLKNWISENLVFKIVTKNYF